MDTELRLVEKEVAPEEKKAKKEKVAFSIDFLNGGDVDEDALFANDTKKSTLMAAKTKEESYLKTLLPEDVHYSEKDLMKLFLKPSFDLVRRPAAGSGDQHDWDEDGFQGAPAAHFDDDDDDDIGGDHLPMDTGIPVYSMSSQMVDQPRKTKVEAINYSKKAKKVDVRKLKDNIWKDLTHVTAPSAKSKCVGDRTFSSVIQDVAGMYDEEKARDITVPFYFICLLHLANEKNLAIEGHPDLQDFIVRQE